MPLDKALHQVCRIKRRILSKAVGDGQCHGGIIGPLPGLQLEWPAADHVLQGRVAVAGFELQRGAHRIADGKAQERAAGPIANGSLGCGRDRFGHGPLRQHKG